MKRSVISLVKNVKTPTLLMTGEEDFRTPISEAEQFYAALKLLKVESALVRFPGEPHGLTAARATRLPRSCTPSIGSTSTARNHNVRMPNPLAAEFITQTPDGKRDGVCRNKIECSALPGA